MKFLLNLIKIWNVFITTEFRNDDHPTYESIGDVENWADSTIDYDGMCDIGYQGVDIDCKVCIFNTLKKSE